jgi:hypothetical protein
MAIDIIEYYNSVKNCAGRHFFTGHFFGLHVHSSLADKPLANELPMKNWGYVIYLYFI